MPTLHHNHPESDERAMPATLTHEPLNKAGYEAFPAEWKPLIEQGLARQRDLKLGDRHFAGNTLSATAWNQLVNGNYRIPTTDAGRDGITAKLATVVERGDKLAREHATKKDQAKALTLAERFVDREEMGDIKDALADAAERLSQKIEERIVFVTGPTRSGKTSLIAKLVADKLVQWHWTATDGLSSCFRAFLEELAAVMRLRDVKGKSVTELKKSLIEKLNGVEGVLAIEEFQTFSGRQMRFIKDLLNHSKATLLIALPPGKYERMVRSGNEDAEQFIGRSVSRIELHVTAALVKAYGGQLWKRCKKDVEALCEYIASEAEQGGAMSLVRDVCANALIYAGESGPVTREHIEKALAAYRCGVPVLGKSARKTFGLAKKKAA